MTRGAYYLLWLEMLLRGLLTMGSLAVLFNVATGTADASEMLDISYTLIIYVPIFCLVMLPLAVNYVVTARWNLGRCIMLSTCMAMIVPLVRIFGGLVGAVRGGWWPDWLLLVGYIGAGLVFGLVIGLLFWLFGALFPWTWRVRNEG